MVRGCQTEMRRNSFGLRIYSAAAVRDVSSGFDVVVATRARVVWIRKESHSVFTYGCVIQNNALVQRDTEVLMCLSHLPPFGYENWIFFFWLSLKFRNCRPWLVPWLNEVIHWSWHNFWNLSLSASRDVKGFGLWRTSVFLLLCRL